MKINFEISENILDDEYGLFWKGSKYYPSDSISNFEKEKISNISVLNLKIDSNNSSYINEIIKKVLDFYDFVYLYTMDHKPLLKSRIRIFKGVVSEIKNNKEQNEVDFGENQSIISELLNIKDVQLENFMKYLNSNDTSFIFLSLKDPGASELLKKITTNYISIDSLTSVDYLNMISSFCDNSDFVLRKGNYPNEDFLSIQLFFNNRYSDMIGDLISKI